jgi:hypothetical protein
MAEWSKNHVAAIGSLKIQNCGLSSGAWLKGRLGGAIRGKERQLVGKIGECVCGEPTPPSCSPRLC